MVTDIIHDNEEQSSEITKLEKEQRRQKRKLKKEYEDFEKQCLAEIARLERNVVVTQKAVQDISDDVERLRKFKVQRTAPSKISTRTNCNQVLISLNSIFFQILLETNPGALQSEIHEVQKNREDRKMQQEQHLINIQKDWEKEQQEMENGWLAKVKVVIDGMNNVSALDEVYLTLCEYGQSIHQRLQCF
jgi:phage shock protein A